MIKCENGVYVEMTPEEIEEYNKLPSIQPKPTIEEQILALQNALITQKISGGGITTITDSSDNRIKDFELFGKSEQVTTTGKNLLEEKLSAFTITNDIAHIPLPEDHNEKQYTMLIQKKSGKNDSVGFSCGFYDKTNMTEIYKTPCLEGGKLVSSNGIVVSKKGVNHYVCFTPASEEFFSIYNVIYTEGNLTSLPYEPYTGGKPSPSPEYPQEIRSVGKYNELTGKYEVEVVLSSKNLLDITACEDGKTLDANGNIVNNANALLSDFIPCFSKTSYCRAEGHFTAVSFYDVEKNKIGFINQYDPCFTTPDKCRYFRFSLNKTKADYEKAVANVGKELADYEPYREPQYLTLSLDQPLRGIGEHKDEVTKDGIVRRIKRLELNDYENWTIHPQTNKENTQAFCFNQSVEFNANAKMMCNRFVHKLTVRISDVEGVDVYAKTNIYINIRKTIASTLEEFKTWLSQNNLVLESVLIEPITEPLPDDFKQALEKLSTYYPTTVITTDGGEVDPDIEVSYIADTKNYIDQKIAPVIKSVVETQKALL